MTDIVERLRMAAVVYADKYSEAADFTEAADEIERLRDLLYRIDQWTKAYPIDIFPEPTKEDFRKARKLLEAGGMTLDSVAASNMRRVVDGIGKIIREA